MSPYDSILRPPNAPPDPLGLGELDDQGRAEPGLTQADLDDLLDDEPGDGGE